MPSGPYHIDTWAYDYSSRQGKGVSSATVAELLSYAQGDGKAVQDCHSVEPGCRAVFYLDPSHVWNNSPSSCVYYPDAQFVSAASEDWFIHNVGYTDKAHRVYGKSAAGCLIWQVNPASTAVQTWWLNYLRSNADSYDLMFLDDNATDLVDATYFHSGGGCMPWPSLCHSTQELPTDAALVTARASFVNAMTYSDGRPMYFISQGNILPELSSTTRYVGESCEGCVAMEPATVRPNMYATVLNDMAAMNNASTAFLLISQGSASAGSSAQILQRLVSTAIVWLGYEEGHTIIQPDLEANTDNLAVWPEDLIYPAQPLQTMASGAADLQVAPGVWRREFGTCYFAGQYFGHCAAILNANAAAVVVKSSWLTQTYHHVVTLSGGDVLSGGIASLSGAAFTSNTTSVPPTGALLITN
jgi:hypothetical protein